MPLEDMNEFTTHILEVVNAHMMLNKSTSQVSMLLGVGSEAVLSQGEAEPHEQRHSGLVSLSLTVEFYSR